jgi:hypothetical protein
LDQSFSGFSQGSEIDLEQAGDAVIVIEAESIAVRDRDQEKVEQDLQGGEIRQEPCGDKAVIDPAEGPFDFAGPFGTKKSFEGHGPYLLISIGP